MIWETWDQLLLILILFLFVVDVFSLIAVWVVVVVVAMDEFRAFSDHGRWVLCG